MTFELSVIAESMPISLMQSSNEHFLHADSSIVVGDTIIGIDGKTVENADELIVAVRAKQPGDSVKLLLLANGSKRTVKVVLAASSD